MKRLFLICLLAVAGMVGAWAYDFEVNGICYNVTNKSTKEVEVTYRNWNYNSYFGDVVIPDSVSYNGNTYWVTCIGSSAFYFCPDLTSVTIPDGVTSFGDWFFPGCNKLTSIIVDGANPIFSSLDGVLFNKEGTVLKAYPPGRQGAYVIPDGVTSVEGKAFYGCSGLTSVCISEEVASIEDGAFAGCSNLTSVEWNAMWFENFTSDNTPFYGEALFYDSDGFVSIAVFDLRDQITSFTFGDNVMYIPAYLCSGMKKLTSITIPEKVMGFGECSFVGCSSLTTAIWNTINYIDFTTNNTPFYSCDNFDLRSQITSFTFGDRVEHVPAYLCTGMKNLDSLTFLGRVKSIGSDAFNSCYNLKTLHYDDTMESWCQIDFATASSNPLRYADNVFIDKQQLKGELTIPKGIKSIKDYAFYGCHHLTSLAISNEVTNIGKEAFYSCYYLTSISIPDRVTNIGEGAFRACSSLTSVTIGNGITSIGAYTFSNCTNLVSLIVPDGVKSIAERAFSGCSGLVSVTIGEGVTSIDSHAFEDCSNLASVVWNAVNCENFTIGNTPFYCYNDDEYSVDFDVRGKITAFTFGEEVEHIPDFLCAGMEQLASVAFLGGVTSIGESAFANCNDLITLRYDGTLNSWCQIDFATATSNPMGYADRVFINRQQVEGKMNLPDGLTEIKDYVFYGCNALTSVIIPDKVINIGNEAFYDCCNLASITIPDMVTSIGNKAFYNCGSLASISIPKTITSIGHDAFEGCHGMDSVFYTGDMAQWCKIYFKNEYSNPISHGHNLYMDNQLVVEVEIPKETTEINDYAFYGCSHLASIAIGEEVTSIGYNAFYGCNSLTSVTWKPIRYQDFASGDTPFCDEYKFDLREQITSFTFGDKVQHIPAWLCAGMSKLTAISLPSSVTSIGTSAFVDCPAVKDLYSHALMPPVLAGDPSSLEGHPFAGLTETANLYVPCGAEFDYFTYSYWAVFKNIIGVEHQVLVMVDDGSKGTAALTQPVLCETSEAVIAATPNADYIFTQWSDGNTDNPRTVTVTSDTLFTALFAPAVCQVNLNTNDPFMGNVTGGGEYAYGTSATIEAVPAEGYRFVQWSDGNTDNPRTVVVTDNLTLTAEFEPKEVTGLDDVTRQLTVTTEQHNILIYGASDSVLSVYTVQGTCLYRGTAEAEPTVIPVPSAGMYVVMIGEEMVKVVVR